MKKINIGSNIKIYWKIWRGANKVTEDFNSMNTNLNVFLVGSGDTYYLEPSINNTVDPGYDIIELDIPAFRLDVGVYNIKAIWEKNGGRNVLTSARASVLYLTDNPSEAPIQDEKVRIVSLVESFGRDGMSAYETAVMRGVNEGITSEIEWVKSVSVFNEKERLANEEVRMANEAERIANEAERRVAEKRREWFKEGLLEQVNSYKPIEITGDVTNAADEEDITSDENNLLKLKDRTSINGMGYKILRMGKPLQEQMDLSNTIYEVRYKFDLKDGTLTIPEHCIIRYNGGSFKNGTIIYNDTLVEGTECVENITSEGDVKHFYDERVDAMIVGATSPISEQVEFIRGGVLELQDELTTSTADLNAKIDSSTADLREELGNIADEEDLTIIEKQDKLSIQQKDRQGHDSMGYKILRMGTSLQNQMNISHTIYEVRYNFDLNGGEVTVPNGCVLKFCGGRIVNGKIIGNYTIIEASPVQIFDLNTTIEGTWSIEYAYAEWFGAIGDEMNDDRPAIQKTMDSFYVTKLLSKRYLLDSFTYTEPNTGTNVCLVLPPKKTLCGENLKYSYNSIDINGNINTDENGLPIKIDSSQGTFFRANLAYKKRLKGKAAILSLHPMTTVENIGIGGNVRAIEHDPEYRTTGITIEGRNSYRITLRNVDVWSCYYAVNMACWMSRFEYVMCRYNLYGMVIHGAMSGYIGIWDIYSNSSPTMSSVITSCFFNNCYCNGNFLGGYRLLGLTYSSMTSCAADGCGTFSRENMYDWGTDEYGNKLAPPKELQTATYDNIKYAYVFEKCYSMNISALGGEEDLKGIKTIMCRNVTIENSYFYNYYTYYTQMGGSEAYETKNFISSNGDTNVVYKDIFFNLKEENLSHDFIAAAGVQMNKSFVTFKNMLTPSGPFGIESIKSSGHLPGSIVRIEHIEDTKDYDMSTVTYPSNTDDFVYSFSNSNIRTYLSSYYKNDVSLNPRKLIVDLTKGGYTLYIIDGGITGNNDTLHIIGDAENKSQLSVNGGVTFRKFKTVIFENVSIIHGTTNNLDTLMNFRDGVAAVFINCTFERKSTLTLNRFFNSDNISFNRCANPDAAGSTRPTYTSEEYGRSFFDTTLNKVVWWNGSEWVDGANVNAG